MRCFIIKKSRILTFFNIIIALIVAVSLTITVIAVEKSSNGEVLPITKVETAAKAVALTVNVYELTDTDAFLDFLGENKATFFISETFQEKYPEKVKAIAENGHSVGLLMNGEENLSKKELYDYLAVRIERMARITGENSYLVRFNAVNSDKSAAAKICSVGLLPVHYSETKKELSAGEILIAKDSDEAESLVKKTVAEGFETATVDELIKLGE